MITEVKERIRIDNDNKESIIVEILEESSLNGTKLSISIDSDNGMFVCSEEDYHRLIEVLNSFA